MTPPADADRSASGLRSKVLEAGSGEQRPQREDKVRVNFSAWNARGKLVDGSDKRGGPQTFAVSGVIAGWSEALQAMRVGERRKLWIPDELVYPGRPGFPRAMSVFEVELLEIEKGTPAPPAPANVAAAPREAVRTASGLVYQVVHDAPGIARPRAWDRVTLNHSGWTQDGASIESSQRNGRPSVFDVATVMPGWREALPRLSVGDRVRLWIPEALAYQGRAGLPKGTVVFDLELLKIERRPEPPRAPADAAHVPADAKRTASGLAYRLLARGVSKTRVHARDRVEVQYAVWNTAGELVDTSRTRGKAALLPVRRLIPGWAEGLQLMAPGDRALFWIPEHLAYAGRPGAPKGALLYEVELRSIRPR